MLARLPSLVFLTALLIGCTKAPTASPWPVKPGLKVLATFAPISCFVSNVAGEHGTVRGIMSIQGPHEFDPLPADAVAVTGADLFFINGLELDNRIADKMKASSGNKLLNIVDLGSKMEDKRLLEGECNHDQKDGHKHEHGMDPHIWLGPDMAIAMIETIRDEMKKADTSHAADYDRNASEYLAKLAKLHADGKAMLGGKKIKVLTMHESMGYFARAFDVEIVGSIQPSPGQEPTRKKLDEIIAASTDKGVSIIAVEPQYGTSSAVRVIQRELKARGKPELKVVELDPLETCAEAVPAMDFYEKKMRANLAALAEAIK